MKFEIVFIKMVMFMKIGLKNDRNWFEIMEFKGLTI